MKKIVLLMFMLLLMGAGCLSTNDNQQSGVVSKLENARDVNKDNKRIDDVKWLSSSIQLYKQFYEELPSVEGVTSIKSTDELAVDQFTKLMRDSQLWSEETTFPKDPDHPERFYEYQTNGNSYTITTMLTSEMQGCEKISEDQCLYALQSN